MLLATGDKPALDDNFGGYSTSSTPSLTYYHTCMVVWKRFIGIILNLVDDSLAVQGNAEYNSVYKVRMFKPTDANNGEITRWNIDKEIYRNRIEVKPWDKKQSAFFKPVSRYFRC